MPKDLINFISLILPALFLFYLSIEVLLRDRSSPKHRLASLLTFTVTFMLISEYLTISPHLRNIRYWTEAGLTLPLALLTVSIAMHFYLRVTKIFSKINYYIICLLSYTPFTLYMIAFFTGYTKTFFYDPTYSTLMKQTLKEEILTTFIGILLLYLLIYNALLFYALKKANQPKKRKMYGTLLFGTAFLLFWYGFVFFSSFLLHISVYDIPNYLYFWGDVIWILSIRWSMLKYDFLPAYSKRYELLYTLSPLSILLIDRQAKIIEANPRAVELLNYQIGDILTPFPFSPETDLHLLFTKKQPCYGYEVVLLLPSRAEPTYFLINYDFVDVDHRPLMMVTLQDITDRKEAERRYEYLAFHDFLTGLPNRRLFNERLMDTVNHASKDQYQFAVILIDLDSFKEVNDKHGHETGDRLLKHVAQLLRENSENDELAARYGGDEFVILIPKIDTKDDIQKRCSILGHFFKEPFQLHGQAIEYSFSFGVGVFPDDGTDVDSILRRADDEMYKMKIER